MTRQPSASGYLDALKEVLEGWSQSPPTRQEMEGAFERLALAEGQGGFSGLFSRPPLMLLATLDDGMGHGIDLIGKCARAAGFEVRSLGLMLDSREILAACREQQPHVLGLTVLRQDMEDELIHIGKNLPEKTILTAGGPVFQASPDLAREAGVACVARDAADYLRWIVKDFFPLAHC